jgi:hypothetical protein
MWLAKSNARNGIKKPMQMQTSVVEKVLVCKVLEIVSARSLFAK